MAKERTFAAKLKKEAAEDKCPVCNQPKSPVKVIKSVKSDSPGAWKFMENIVKTCKCNQTEVMG